MLLKVFVTGCFDLLHSGHVAFFKNAAYFGDLYVGVGRDETVLQLKGKAPCNPEAERLFMVRSQRYVKDAWISSGLGLLDFAEDLERLQPDIFIVNEDGDAPEKAALCAQFGIEYRVLQREPEPGLPLRSTSLLRGGVDGIPYRAELCGAWLDQPFVNKRQPGYVICAQLEPNKAFDACSGGGLASSTRAFLSQLKAAGVSRVEPESLARMVFRLENGIDRQGHSVSGAQDALGLCLGGVSFQYYDSGYWPVRVQTISDEETLCWLESHLSLYALFPRPAGFNPLDGCDLQRTDSLEALARSAQLCKSAIEEHELDALAESFTQCREAQTAIFPAMLDERTHSEIKALEDGGHIKAWKFTGAGGGGWLLLLDAKNLPGAIPLKISVRNPVANGENY